MDLHQYLLKNPIKNKVNITLNKIFLLRQSKTINTIVLVEGNDDVKFFKPKLNEAVSIISTYGYPTLIKVLNILKYNVRNIKGVFGIRDSDYTKFYSISYKNENLIFTDFHDLESTILNMDNVKSKISQELCYANINRFVDKVIILCKPIGYLRYKKLLFKEQICQNNYYKQHISTLACYDLYKLLTEINNPCINIQKTINDINVIDNSTTELLNLCNGHDLVSLLYYYSIIIAPTSNIKDKLEKKYCVESISSMLRQSCEYEDFKQTTMYKEILNWEIRNPTFKVHK